MAKSKFPKINDTNETANIASRADGSEPGNGESSASFASATSAEKGKAKTVRGRAKNATPKSSTSGVVPKLEAVPGEHRTNGEAKTDGAAQTKAENRGNVVPINMEDEIRRLAYLLSERRGFEPGHEREDWLAAEREVLQRYRQQSA